MTANNEAAAISPELERLRSELAAHPLNGSFANGSLANYFDGIVRAMWNAGLTTRSPVLSEEAVEVVAAVKEALRGDYTDFGMESAFFRWPVVERALIEALSRLPQGVEG